MFAYHLAAWVFWYAVGVATAPLAVVGYVEPSLWAVLHRTYHDEELCRILDGWGG